MRFIKNFSITILLLIFFQNSFAQADDTARVSVSRIILIGNKVTRDNIIYHELIFHVGDTLPEEVLERAMERSRENLMNTLLFNFVEIQKLSDINNQRTLVVNVTERWYIFPVPIVEFVDRNFNVWWQTKDFTRLNYGFAITDNNFRGARELFQLSARFGYSQRFSFNYVIPFISSNTETGLQLQGGYNRNHEISYTLDDSKLVYFKNEKDYVRKEYYGIVRYTIRDHIYNYHSITSEYSYSSIADTVQKLNPEYFINDAKYGQFIALTYMWARDVRDYKIYARRGYYFDIGINKAGFGILKNEPSLTYITSTFKNINRLTDRLYFAYSFKGRIAPKNEAPYYNQRALGYLNDFVRGYEYYVVNGQDYVLAKANLRFALLPQHILHIRKIETEKFNTIPYAFYLNAYCEAGYVKDNVFAATNPLANHLLPGYGIGLDFVTYYDIVFRVEYSFNKFGEHGIFIHFGNAL